MSLLTAAAISGVMPGASAVSVGGRRLVREQEVAEFADRQMRDRREGGRIVRVDDQPRDLVALVGDERFFEEALQRQSARQNLAATFSSAQLAAIPASMSPERGGVALAMRSASDPKAQRVVPVAEENVAAKLSLADMPLKRFLEETLRVPYESDEITTSSSTRMSFARISHLTFREFRNFLLSDEKQRPSNSHRAGTRHQRRNSAAAVSKTDRNQDLILAGEEMPGGSEIPRSAIRATGHDGGAAAARTIRPTGSRRRRRLDHRWADVWQRRCR